MLVMKLTIASLLVGSLYYLMKVALIGRRMAHPGPVPGMLDEHRASTNGVLCTTLTAIVLLEFVVHAPELHAQSVPEWLLLLHVPAAALFLSLFLCAKYVVTGEYNPRLHRKLTYMVLLCFLVALPTGFAMLYMI